MKKIIDYNKLAEITGESFWDFVDEVCDQFNCEHHFDQYVEKFKDNPVFMDYVNSVIKKK